MGNSISFGTDSLTRYVKYEKNEYNDNNHFVIANFICNSGTTFKEKDSQENFYWKPATIIFIL